MAFEIKLKNGYTGNIIGITVSPEDRITSIANRASELWRLPNVKHVAIAEDMVLTAETRLIDARIGRGSTLEIIPDPWQ